MIFSQIRADLKNLRDLMLTLLKEQSSASARLQESIDRLAAIMIVEKEPPAIEPIATTRKPWMRWKQELERLDAAVAERESHAIKEGQE
jgi:hypothetical protein